jgi:hypothetical protein
MVVIYILSKGAPTTLYHNTSSEFIKKIMGNRLVEVE